MPIEDDGSFAARLSGRPGLVDAILGRSLLDPAGPGLDASTLPAQIAALVDVRGTVSVADLDATITTLEAVQAHINTLDALAALLLERVRRQALRADGLLDSGEPMVQAATSVRRRELACRTAVAEVALALHQGEHAVATRMHRGQALTARAPRTLTAAIDGRVPWVNAGKVADAVAELDPHVAARLDASVAHPATCQNPRRFARTLRRTREHLSPTPPEVRHADAATRRGVWADPGADGMAWLTLYAPAPAIGAITDRLTTTAKAIHSDGDGRTTAQLRADITCALLLDDGTLDLHTAATAAINAGTGTEASSTAPASTGSPGTAVPRGATPGTMAGTAVSPRTIADPQGRTAFSLATYARTVRPKIYVTVPVLTLLGRADAPALLNGQVPIDADTARELAGLATSFTRLLTHPKTGHVLSVSAETYRPPADLRHYLTTRDNTCRFPGCDRPATRADTDHTVAYADGGTTTATNLATLCRRHHVLKHQARYTVHHTDDHGTLAWTTPTGRVHHIRADLIPATIHHTPETGADPGPPPGPPPGIDPAAIDDKYLDETLLPDDPINPSDPQLTNPGDLGTLGDPGDPPF